MRDLREIERLLAFHAAEIAAAEEAIAGAKERLRRAQLAVLDDCIVLSDVELVVQGIETAKRCAPYVASQDEAFAAIWIARTRKRLAAR